jgi:hypothetical protein
VSAHRLDVTPALVRRVVSDVAPLVAHLTGWHLNTDGLDIRVIPRDQGYEEIVVAGLRHAGLHVDLGRPRTALERLDEYVLEESILAAYQPGSHELIVVRENVDDSNLDGLRLVVSHELVHFGQHCRYPFLFQRVCQTIRCAAVMGLSDGVADPEAAQRELGRIQEIMTLLESHAAFVEQSVKRLYLPRAEVKSHFNIATVLFQMLGAQKICQYTEGVPRVAAAVEAGEVDALYLGTVDLGPGAGLGF